MKSVGATHTGAALSVACLIFQPPNRQLLYSHLVMRFVRCDPFLILLSLNHKDLRPTHIFLRRLVGDNKAFGGEEKEGQEREKHLDI